MTRVSGKGVGFAADQSPTRLVLRGSGVRGKADPACQGLSGPFLATSGHFPSFR
jgi:hypothetical protein